MYQEAQGKRQSEKGREDQTRVAIEKKMQRRNGPRENKKQT